MRDSVTRKSARSQTAPTVAIILISMTSGEGTILLRSAPHPFCNHRQLVDGRGGLLGPFANRLTIRVLGAGTNDVQCLFMGAGECNADDGTRCWNQTEVLACFIEHLHPGIGGDV